jgi:hypothetical protein
MLSLVQRRREGDRERERERERKNEHKISNSKKSNHCTYGVIRICKRS